MSFTQSTINLGLPQFQTSDVPTWADINAAFALIDTVVGALAPKFDATDTYSQGDYVQYEGAIYKAKGAISAGTFDPSDWDPVVITTVMQDTADLTNVVKYDANGTGITANQYAHLTIVS